MKIWEPKPPEPLWATTGLLRESFTFYLCLVGAGRLHLQRSTKGGTTVVPQSWRRHVSGKRWYLYEYINLHNVTFQENTIHNVTILNTDYY